MDTVLASLIAAVAALLGTVAGSVLQQRAARQDAHRAQDLAHLKALREAVVALAHALSVHRGHLYDRWQLAQDDADPHERETARHTSHASRGAVTLALYRLRALTRNAGLLHLADDAVDAAYAVKHKGEDLTAITPADMHNRRNRGIAADNALLAAAAGAH